MSETVFDALSVKKVFWQTERTIPGTNWHIRGYSRSAFRTGFYIPDLDIMLDAGPQCFSKPSHIFITHTHCDHIAALPFTLIGDEAGTHMFHIHVPRAAEQYVENYIKAMFQANCMVTDIDMSGWFTLHPRESGNTFDIQCNKVDLRVEVFKCDHKIPTISYGFTETKQKLRAEYASLHGSQIAALRKAGTEITEAVPYKRFAYVCDTSIAVFDENPSLLTYPVIMIECTFLYPDELGNAAATQHIHWQQLEKHVVENPGIQFIVFHFSQRYRDAEINEFFNTVCSEKGINNVMPWIQET